MDRRIARQFYDRHCRLGKDGGLTGDTMPALKELFTRAYEQPTDVGDAIIERLCWLESLDEMIRGQRAVLTGVLGKLRATNERKLFKTLSYLHSSHRFQARLLQTSPVLLLD